MSSGISMNYAVYQLIPKQFVYPPDGFRCCPNCGGTLSKSDISPSKAVTSYVDTATMGYNDFSNLYECPTCHWWAVWECYGDAEATQHFHYLIASLGDENQSSQDEPWNKVLVNEHVHDHDVSLPKSLEQVFIGGKRRILALPRIGDKVRLIGDVHMVWNPETIPFEMTPLFIGGSEGTVVSSNELYDLVKNENKENLELYKTSMLEAKTRWKEYDVDIDVEVDKYIKSAVYRWSLILEMMNCCPIRLEKLVVQPGKERQNTCKKGEIYLIDAANIQKI